MVHFLDVVVALLSAALLVEPGSAQAAPTPRTLGWPWGSVEHRFWATPNGHLHYVIGGNLNSSKGPVLLLLHSHPRSTTEWHYFTEALGGQAPFIAVDYFGMGQSEDYRGKNASDEFCTVEAYAHYLLQILAREEVWAFAAIGNLKGVHAAAEVAAQAGPGRVLGAVYINTIMLDKKGRDYIERVFIPGERKTKLRSNGSHLMDVWRDASSAAFGPGGAPWDDPRDLMANEEKTIDELRCLFTGWQYTASWVAYNDREGSRMAEVDAFSRTLVLDGELAIRDDAKYGLNPQHTADVFSRALTHGHNVSQVIRNGTQGAIIQNATLIATTVMKFLGDRAELLHRVGEIIV